MNSSKQGGIIIEKKRATTVENISAVTDTIKFKNHGFKQAPYQDITEEEYNEWLKKMPKD